MLIERNAASANFLVSTFLLGIFFVFLSRHDLGQATILAILARQHLFMVLLGAWVVYFQNWLTFFEHQIGMANKTKWGWRGGGVLCFYRILTHHSKCVFEAFFEWACLDFLWSETGPVKWVNGSSQFKFIFVSEWVGHFNAKSWCVSQCTVLWSLHIKRS